MAEPMAEPMAAGAEAGSAADDVYDIEIQVREYSHAIGDDSNVPDVLTSLLRMIAENLKQMAPPQVQQAMEMLGGIDVREYLTADFWHAIASVVELQAKEQLAFIQRRLQGDYHTDPYGLDPELVEVARPFLSFLYNTWWRVACEGIDYVPEAGRGLLVSNHSGVLPWDGAMIATAVYEEHTTARIVRNLFLHWFSTLPFVGTTMSGLGSVPGIPGNAVRLLEEDELVCTFPEGLKGVGKLFQNRYRLARFGRGGFVQTALRTRSPIVPVAVVGAEEIYPMVADARPIANLFGMPYFPITPTFPWLGPVGMIPLPTRWSITFCPPLPIDEYGPDDADDPLVVFMLAEKVRGIIQETINHKLAERGSVF